MRWTLLLALALAARNAAPAAVVATRPAASRPAGASARTVLSTQPSAKSLSKAAPLFLGAAPAVRGIDEDDAHEPETFDYTHHGTDWTGTCATGKHQSPIPLDLFSTYDRTPNTTSVRTGLGEPTLAANVVISPIKIKVTSDAFAENVWMKVTRHDGTKTSERTLELLQFHFHSPAEHTLNGERYDGELHFVFEEVSKREIEVVLGILLKNTGTPNKLITQLMDAQAASKEASSKAKQIKAGVNVKASFKADLKFDPQGLLHTMGMTKDFADAITYAGSLTTPVCTEGLTWVLIDGEMDQAQTDWLSLLHESNAVGNYRAEQPLNGRAVGLTKVSDDSATVAHALLASATLALVSFLV